MATASMPAKTGTAGYGGLADETLTLGYDGVGSPITLSGLASYAAGTGYLQTGHLSSVTVGPTGKQILQYFTYEHGTMRPTEHQVLGDLGANAVAADTSYAYDPAGNVTSAADLMAQWGAGPDDTQCYRYDALRRLTQAWTPTSGSCTADPMATGLGGPAPYWSSYASHSGAEVAADLYNVRRDVMLDNLQKGVIGPVAHAYGGRVMAHYCGDAGTIICRSGVWTC